MASHSNPWPRNKKTGRTFEVNAPGWLEESGQAPSEGTANMVEGLVEFRFQSLRYPPLPVRVLRKFSMSLTGALAVLGHERSVANLLLFVYALFRLGASRHSTSLRYRKLLASNAAEQRTRAEWGG